MSQLKCPGVGRDKDNLNALQFYFSRRATDDEMRFLHEVMKRAVASCKSEPCRPDDTLKRRTICGFIVDTRYAVEFPRA